MNKEQLIENLRQLHMEKLGVIFQYLNHHYMGTGADVNGNNGDNIGRGGNGNGNGSGSGSGKGDNGDNGSCFNFVTNDHSAMVVNRFRETANEAMIQADRIAERIHELGGEPQNDIAPILSAEILPEMVHYNLASELELIERCRNVAELAESSGDHKTRSLVVEIAESKQDHTTWLETVL